MPPLRRTVWARRCGAGGPDHRLGREDDSARPGGSSRLAGCRTDQATAAAAWGRATAGRNKDPAILTTLQELVEPVTAGDPMSEQKWVRVSLRQVSRDLGEAGHSASPPTVRRLLDAQGYRLHANTKQLESSAAHPDRDRQFEYITEQRQGFSAAGLPQISVDTKKQELIGQFKNAGRVWSQEAETVNVHDFRPDAPPAMTAPPRPANPSPMPSWPPSTSPATTFAPSGTTRSDRTLSLVPTRLFPA